MLNFEMHEYGTYANIFNDQVKTHIHISHTVTFIIFANF